MQRSSRGNTLLTSWLTHLRHRIISRRQALTLIGIAIVRAMLAPLITTRALFQSGGNDWETSHVEYVPASTQRICQLTGDFDAEGLPHINHTGQWGIEGT